MIGIGKDSVFDRRCGAAVIDLMLIPGFAAAAVAGIEFSFRWAFADTTPLSRAYEIAGSSAALVAVLSETFRGTTFGKNRCGIAISSTSGQDRRITIRRGLLKFAPLWGPSLAFTLLMRCGCIQPAGTMADLLSSTGTIWFVALLISAIQSAITGHPGWFDRLSGTQVLRPSDRPDGPHGFAPILKDEPALGSGDDPHQTLGRPERDG